MNRSTLRLFGEIVVMMVILAASADANAPVGQYVVTAGGTADGTVYDTKSKLTWQQSASSTAYGWQDAKIYCSGMIVNTGWRLPTIKELMTLFDYSQKTVSIDSNAFPGTPAAVFWSVSAVANSSSKAWAVDFADPSNDIMAGRDMSSTAYVRCVR